MVIDLTGKRAIVSGSTLGIGFAIAQGLAASGATVVINGPSQTIVDAALSRLAEMLPEARVEGIAADLSGPGGVAIFMARARRPTSSSTISASASPSRSMPSRTRIGSASSRPMS
jgi:NAD(P)-dependent dehydrogenase (short-subunit alcohol dehydrogenase family)